MKTDEKTIDAKAEEIAALIIAEKFEGAKTLWKQHTTGMKTKELMMLRERIEFIEQLLIAGFEETVNSETGEL